MGQKLFLKRGVVFGYLLAFVVTVALGAFAYLGKEKLLDTGQVFSHSLRIVNTGQRLLAICLDIESGQRGFVITGSTEFLQYYDSAVLAFEREMELLTSLTHGSATQSENVRQLEQAMRDKIARTNSVIQTRKEQGFEQAQAMIAQGDGRAMTGKVRAAIDKIRADEERTLNATSIMGNGALDRFQAFFIVLLMIPSIIMAVLFWSTNRNFERRLKYEASLEAASAEITKLNKELESFSYSVSHDLRAPLRAINGYAEILKEEYGKQFDEDGLHFLGVITNNARRMGHLIDDLLEFSKVGRRELNRTKVNTEQLVRMIIDECLEQGGRPPVEFKVQQHLPPSLADHNMLRQVWINLISNAIKYSGKRPQPVVEIGSFSEPESNGFYIRDNGVGFDMKYVDKLFGVFQRLHKMDEFEGTGVGLALVKQIINRHHGRVWVEAKPGEGATFYFTLPRT